MVVVKETFAKGSQESFWESVIHIGVCHLEA
jgi:hypothetical protein